jgi:hypothetical protein
MKEPPIDVSDTMSHAAIIGAKPTVDSRDRSNFPQSRMIDSAMTRIDSSEDC